MQIRLQTRGRYFSFHGLNQQETVSDYPCKRGLAFYFSGHDCSGFSPGFIEDLTERKMPLHVLEKAIEPIQKEAQKKDFATLIRQAREAIGLKLYRAAEYVGIAPARLKNLETGYFRMTPTSGELEGFAGLYDLSLAVLEEKAAAHVEARKRTLKVGTTNAPLPQM
jgi:hypothetical protein